MTKLTDAIRSGARRHVRIVSVAIALTASAILLALAAAESPAATTSALATKAICSEVSYGVTELASQYTVRGTLCRPPKGVRARSAVLLVHGDTYSRVYWDFPYEPSRYSAARILAGNGYLTLAIDRLGSGKSDLPPAELMTPDVGADALHQVVGRLDLLAASETSSGKVFVAGHSGGSALALREAARFKDVDGLIVTGFLHSFGPSGGLVPASFHPTAEDPAFAGDASIPPGYITTQPASRMVFYFPWETDERVYTTDEKTKSYLPGGDSTGFIEELTTGTFARQVDVPVLIVVGAWDLVFCTPPECPQARSEAANYPASPDVRVVVRPRTGHDLNLHLNAAETTELMRRWLDEHATAAARLVMPIYAVG